MLVVVMFAVICFAFTSQPHYTWFTEKRTAKMENRFSIEVTDNIKLCEYEMAENVNGIITEKYDNMSFSYRNNDNQSVHAEITKTNSKENYNVTLVIVDI